MFTLKDKIIVITGASSGIGRQSAIECSKQGAKIILFARDHERLKQTFESLHGINHFLFSTDVTNIIEVESSIKQVVEQIGLIDGFIHCAGIQNTLPLRLHSSDIYLNQFSINVIAGFEICRILSKRNICNPLGASFIIISSVRGIKGANNQVGYSASKGAILSGIRAMAVELANKNIRVNSISPGMVEDTNMTKLIVDQLSYDWKKKNKLEYPLGWVNTKDIAYASVFLLSDEAAKITGINLIIDGGFCAK